MILKLDLKKRNDLVNHNIKNNKHVKKWSKVRIVLWIMYIVFILFLIKVMDIKDDIFMGLFGSIAVASIFVLPFIIVCKAISIGGVKYDIEYKESEELEFTDTQIINSFIRKSEDEYQNDDFRREQEILNYSDIVSIKYNEFDRMLTLKTHNLRIRYMNKKFKFEDVKKSKIEKDRMFLYMYYDVDEAEIIRYLENVTGLKTKYVNYSEGIYYNAMPLFSGSRYHKEYLEDK